MMKTNGMLPSQLTSNDRSDGSAAAVTAGDDGPPAAAAAADAALLLDAATVGPGICTLAVAARSMTTGCPGVKWMFPSMAVGADDLAVC